MDKRKMYLSTLWTQQPYPTTKKWYLYKCADFPTANLYAAKDKRRGIIQLPGKLIKVVTEEVGENLQIIGEIPRFSTSGAEVQSWLMRIENPEPGEINWIGGEQRLNY